MCPGRGRRRTPQPSCRTPAPRTARATSASGVAGCRLAGTKACRAGFAPRPPAAARRGSSPPVPSQQTATHAQRRFRRHETVLQLANLRKPGRGGCGFHLCLAAPRQQPRPRDQLLQPMRRPVRRGLIAAGRSHQAVAPTLEGVLAVVGVVDHLLQHAEDCRGGGEVGFCDQNTDCLE